MPNKILSPSRSAATIVLGVALFAMPAYAGFQWVAPAESGASSANAYVPFSPPPLTSAAESPRVSEPSERAKNEEKIDLSTATISKPSSEAAQTGPAVQGFASQVPLTLALRQLLPIGYTFSVDKGVDMNTLVSYKGGRPWDETLKNTLAPVGLVYRKQGTVVTIGLAGGSEQAVEALPPPPSSRAPVHVPAKASGPMNILPPPVTTPAVNIIPQGGWTAERGSTLHKVLTEWCARADVELKWMAEYDYPVEASARFNGGFEEAVRNLLAGFDGARPQPVGELHANSSAGQKVLVIQVRGNSYTN